jgi:glycosyltransferase involved in cell wall biosynthesis
LNEATLLNLHGQDQQEKSPGRPYETMPEEYSTSILVFCIVNKHFSSPPPFRLLMPSTEELHSRDSSHPLVSIIIPVFNERSTLADLIERVQMLPWPKEILLVDDGSNDGGVRELVHLPNVRLFVHPHNRGKGAAIRTALLYIEGEIVVIQDADLEYDPEDLTRLISLVTANEADVAYGSRFRGPSLPGSRLHRHANQLLTWCSNRLTGLSLSDMETCYKVMRREVMDGLTLRENRFGVEPEITAKIARRGWRVVEVPIGYQPRTRSAGKKIGLRDGLRALWCILRYSKWD